jgi:hypothetical protein
MHQFYENLKHELAMSLTQEDGLAERIVRENQGIREQVILAYIQEKFQSPTVVQDLFIPHCTRAVEAAFQNQDWQNVAKYASYLSKLEEMVGARAESIDEVETEAVDVVEQAVFA